MMMMRLTMKGDEVTKGSEGSLLKDPEIQNR